MAKRTYIIGRAGDISLYDDTVSRRHACLEVEDGQLFLRDLDSRNGTYELREKRLVPFSAGAVTRDQVFAFGECVRSVVQLLAEAGDLESLADTAGREAPPPALDATLVSDGLAPRRRLSAADITQLLDRIEAEMAAGKSLGEACTVCGVPETRYERWRREYAGVRGAAPRAGDDVAALRLENERLRRLVSDLSLENAALRETLRAGAAAPAGAMPTVAQPNLSIVRDNKL